jgi:hypothetical protein
MPLKKKSEEYAIAVRPCRLEEMDGPSVVQRFSLVNSMLCHQLSKEGGF